ncbi:MAG: serine/threonine protein kinase, partial [Deltaproteobacteria bacterium]|nr:serine/threonine protein kinase [Deltaproteobacteria bacterium]
MSERYGDYELLRLIATGGMAEIYLARHDGGAGLSRTVVVKRMLPQLAVRPDFVRMFLDEARLAAKLNHPNIVQVFNLGEVAQSDYIAMEFVDGPHLGALFALSLRQRAPLPIEQCVHVVARAADGLHYAHDVHDPATGAPLNLVHRDISPQNLLVSRDGDVKVTDFGVAKASTQQSKTRTGIIKGKVAYMSPEQCLGESVDRRTDVFALGIVLYELLTRRRLFRDKSDLLIMQKITSETVPAPSTVNKDIDAELDAICAKALTRRREERFSSAGELAEALDAWLVTHSRGDPRLALQRWFDQHAVELVVPQRDELSGSDSIARRSVPPTNPGEATSATPSLNSAETVMSRGDARAAVERSETTQLRSDPRTESSAPDDPTAEPEPQRAEGEGAEDEGADDEPHTLRMPRPELDHRHTMPVSPVSPAAEGDGPVEALLPRRKLLPAAAALAAAAVLGAVVIAFLFVGEDPAVSAGAASDGGRAVATGGTVPQGPVARLRVETEPAGVNIVVDDDRIVGKSPASFEHAPGTVRLAAQFADQPPVPLELSVEPGEERVVRLLAKVPLEVKSTPARAKVRVGSVLKGETPFLEKALVTPEEDVTVRIELEGIEPVERVVRAAPGQTLVVTETLAAASSTKRRPPDAQRPPPVAEPGFLNMRSTPWVNVRVAGGPTLGPTIFN